MRPFFEVQTLEAVRERVRALPPLEAETVPLEQAAGRTLARPLHAPHDLPGFARSTMDGYAVRARDTFGATETSPAYVTQIGEVQMGTSPGFTVSRGQCARIGTGGMLPDGADAVVMVEHTRQLDRETVELCRAVAPRNNVMGPTDDAERGQLLLPAGQRLRPQDVGLLAALGVEQPAVVQQPRLGIISTGDEVVPLQQQPGPGQVRDVNSQTLAVQARHAGAIPVRLGLVRDEEAALRRQVDRSRESCHLTLLSGGSSVGVRDLTRDVFLSFAGAELLVHGVSVAPGKPFIWATAGAHQLLGLPGQVTSCMVAFHLFVEPIIERLLGRAPQSFVRFSRLQATLERNLPATPGRESYLRVEVRQQKDGWLAQPVFGKSGLLRTLTASHGLVRVPLGCEGLEAGTEVTVLLFP